MGELPLRWMVLYKHGVGFFVREGVVNAEEVNLVFKQDEVNDVLKSLAVFDRSEGKVLGIHYQTPMDKQARLANSSIRLSDRASLLDLFRDLRGRKVTLTIEDPVGTVNRVSGRVVGVDAPIGDTRNQVLNTADLRVSTLLSILEDNGQVQVLRFNTIRSVTSQDDQSTQDLNYFLDTSMSQDTRRTISVRMTPGEHQLVVHYVAPSPTWRVSYRIVAETDAYTSEKTSETGKALLQGWGLLDNRLEEDLVDVHVTLVAGQPISFIYDLVESRIPVRPTVKDETRITPGPIEYAGKIAGDQDTDDDDEDFGERNYRPQARAHMLRKSDSAPAQQIRAEFAGLAPTPAMLSREQVSKAMEIATSTKDSGEFFQYVVNTPVTVKRGESALVPILGAEIAYRRELLYNGQKLPNHPVAAMRFTNSTGLTLERGPVTVVEDSDYKGEAVIPFTKEGNEVYLPYAVELGVKVTERVSHRMETLGLTVADGYLRFDEYNIMTTTYIVENTTARRLSILIEAAIRADYEHFDTPAPTVETANERRWRVESVAKGKVEFIRLERRLERRMAELRRLKYQELQQYLENRWLDQVTFQGLDEMIKTLGAIQEAQTEKSKLESERQGLYAEQENIRANLQALQPTGQEAQLRKRVLDQLSGSQERL